MTFENVTWINSKLDEIEKTDNPRKELASWFNSLQEEQRVSVFRFAGWLDPRAYASHTMNADGSDNIFETPAESLYIDKKSKKE
jgi:hypothetical protein